MTIFSNHGMNGLARFDEPHPESAVHKYYELKDEYMVALAAPELKKE